MPDIQQRIADVAATRERLLDRLQAFSYEQGRFKSGADAWSIAQHVEHLVIAEMGSVRAVWTAAEALRRGQRHWNVEPQFRGRPVEQIVAETWQPGQAAPEFLIPQGSGPLSYWSAALRTNQMLVEALAAVLQGLDPAEIVAPHPISGPLDALQWLAFLRYHLELHREQIEELARSADFPA
jgi:hypothetical protein